MRAGWIRRACGVHDGEMLLLPQRLKRRHGWVQSEKAVEIKHGFFRNINRRPHRVITRLAMRNDDIKTVGGSALKNHHQPLIANARVRRTKRRAREKTG